VTIITDIEISHTHAHAHTTTTQYPYKTHAHTHAKQKVEKQFRLDLTDEEAEYYMLSLINESVNALFPPLMDKIHKWALYWK